MDGLDLLSKVVVWWSDSVPLVGEQGVSGNLHETTERQGSDGLFAFAIFDHRQCLKAFTFQSGRGSQLTSVSMVILKI